MERTGPATLINCSSVFGVRKTPVCHVMVSEPRPYAQFPVAVEIRWQAAGNRKLYVTEVTPDDPSFVLIEVAGKVIYDSRSDVPCDMSRWQETWRTYGVGKQAEQLAAAGIPGAQEYLDWVNSLIAGPTPAGSEVRV